MSVSFTGVNNLKVLKSNKQGYGLFQGSDGEVKQGVKKLTEIKLRFNLTDDAAGKDMSELRNALKASLRGYSYNPKEPDMVELHLKDISGDDGVVKSTQSLLSLNGQDIQIKKREDLALYTYLAKLTRKIANLPETSTNQKECINMVNTAVDRNAIYYIDYVM